MTLTLEVSPETALRVECAKAQGIDMETLLCRVLEEWKTNESTVPPQSVVLLSDKYEGEAWDELSEEIAKNRQNAERNNLFLLDTDSTSNKNGVS